VGTAEELTTDLHTMSDHRAVAVFTPGRYRLNRTLETVERMPLTSSDEIKALVVFVPANLALSHDAPLLAQRAPSKADMPVDVVYLGSVVRRRIGRSSAKDSVRLEE
jgi:hypothetical protein